jgi:TonB-linked SusC/RagA family outer membrane protein
LSFFFLSLILGGNSLVLAQVSGIIISSEDNEPVIGASIAVDGSSVGTVSGQDGKFLLNSIPSGSNRLTVSFLGYQTQTLPFKNGDYLTVVLESEASLLDEVIVVAYGTSTRRQFTGSASVVNADAIGKIQTSSVTNALEGKATGVQIVSSTGQPGENPNVRIRGIGSINAAKNPLYIVDGATYDGPISALNSADIENLTVLKDAAANSLYGARGANGVILITTKRGNTAETKVSFDAKWGVNSRAVPEYDLITNKATYYEQVWKGQFNKLYDAYTARTNNPLSPEAAAAQAKEDLAGNGANALSTILGGYNNYNVSWAELLDGNGKLNPNASLLYEDDWHDALFRNSLRQEYNLNLTGGDSKQNYYVGFGYLNDESYAKGSGFDRYTGRIRGEKELTEWLKGGVNLSYAHTIQNYPLTSGASYVNYFQWTRNIGPIYPVYLRDPVTGETIKDKDGNAIYDYGDSNELGYTRPYAARSNPAGVLDYDINRILRDNIIGSTFLEAQLYDGLSLKGAFDINTSYQTEAYLTNPTYGDGVSYNGLIEQYILRYLSYTGSAFLNYRKTFGQWNVDFLAGAENYRRERYYLYGSKNEIATSYEPEFSNGVAFRDLTSYTQKHSVLGYLSRLNVSYRDKYYLSGSFRRDASSRFAPENRWGNFGSVGASWRISEEDFLRDVDFIDNLKLKGSAGSQGNDNLLYTDGTTNYIPYADQYEVINNNGSVSIKQTYVGNRDISWEKSLNFNAGVEARLLNRINLGVEYFSKTTSDLLFYKPIHLSSGIGSLPVNLGKIKNAGVEFEIDADIVKTPNWVWNIGLNLSHVKNTVLSLPEENRESGIFATGYTKLVEGGSLYDIYLPDFAGIDENGKNTWNVYNADGSFKETTTVYNNAYTDASRRNQGSAIPDFIGGFSTNITYKGVDLSAVFSYQLGGKVYDNIYASTLQMTYYGESFHKDILNAWTPENTGTSIPRLVYGYTDANRASSRYLTEASYLNIRNISIGYTLPKAALKMLRINRVRIFAAGDNLAFFSKRKGLDPRQYDYGSTGFNYSPIRTISFGLNVTL